MESGLIFSESDLYLKYSMNQVKRWINFKIGQKLIKEFQFGQRIGARISDWEKISILQYFS